MAFFNVWYAAAAVLAAVVVRFFAQIYQIRRRFANLPGLKHSMILGHLEAMDKFGFAKYHPHGAMDKMHRACGLDLIFLDVAPVSRPLVVLNTAELAEQVSGSSPAFPTSLYKVPEYSDASPAMGQRSILTLENDEWKALRKQFNPGFQAAHLNSLVPEIIRETQIFCDSLGKHVGEVVKITDFTSPLTVDIIGQVLFAQRLNAQVSLPELTVTHEAVVDWSFKTEEINLLKKYNPVRPLVLRGLVKKLDIIVRNLILENRKLQGEAKNRSIISLALPAGDISEKDMLEAIDQVKTFFFAGHDTTSTTLAWLFYELSKHQDKAKKLVAELDELFGADKEGREERTASLLCEKTEEMLSKLVYTTACLKETLRLHPRASTCRYSPPGTGFTINHNGTVYNVDDLTIMINQVSIHRDRKVYGEDADVFNPDRWLEPNFSPGKSFRPFETGQRNCIGQALAMLEGKIIVAMAIRKFDFEKVGYDGITEEEVYDIRTVAASPVDKMQMRVLLRE